ncbi:MAG: hypothetical protein JETCAE03_34110 [Ignavibacteriaceae bacterium]|jgi:hypothetical protein|nr:MAG: hypothetical protein JETCAE03_34110 [Ignavibacteriaceae bacterium]
MRRKTKLEGATLQYGTGFNLSNDVSITSTWGGLSSGDEYYQFDAAEVVDVIYSKDHPNFSSNDDLGKAKVRLLDRQKDASDDILIWAWPANPAMIQYPVKKEIVNLIQFLGRYFYINTLNYSNNVNHNAVPGASESTQKDNKDNTEQYQKVSSSNLPQKQQEKQDVLGDTFKDNSQKIKPLLPFEGDVIIRGRFGNNIRLGNNPQTNSPVIKMTIGQSVDVDKTVPLEPYIENINDDQNSIWITADEVVDLNPVTKSKSYYLKSARNAPNTFEGNQIVINSDRIIWNAKQQEILAFANKGIALNTNGYIAIDSSENIGLSTLDKLNITAKNGTYVDSKEIILGKNATERMVLGDTLVEILDDLLAELIAETHLTGAGESSPPKNAPKYAKIRAKLRQILSKQNKTL